MTTSEGFEGEKNKTIVMYATSEKGDGFVMRIGEYESIEEVATAYKNPTISTEIG